MFIYVTISTRQVLQSNFILDFKIPEFFLVINFFYILIY